MLEELEAGGISGDQVRFLCALGNHAPLTREDFVKKLGEDIVERYAIYNHNPFEHLVKVGVDSAGADVLVNREYMACDVRIGIGACSPHPMNGFSGGGKLLFPGIAGIQTTLANHKRREFSVFSTEPCGLRRDIEAMTRMTGPFFKIDAILNAKLDIVDVYAGDAVEEHRYAMEASRRLNALHRQGEKKDVVVVNANAKYNEALIAVRIGNMELKEGGRSGAHQPLPRRAGHPLFVQRLRPGLRRRLLDGLVHPTQIPRRADHLLHPLSRRDQSVQRQRAGQDRLCQDLGAGAGAPVRPRPRHHGSGDLRRHPVLFSPVAGSILPP